MRAKISSHPIRLQDPSIIDILGRKQPVSSRFFSLMLRDSNHGKTTCKTITTGYVWRGMLNYAQHA